MPEGRSDHDLIDERFDLFEYEPNTYITASAELRSSGCLEGVPKSDARWVASGSARHRALWSRGMVKLLTALRSSQALEKVLVNVVFWSSEMDDGGPLPAQINGTSIEDANEHLKWMYEQLAQFLAPAQFITYDPDQLRLNRVHRWGISPFHFTESFYTKGIESLKARTKSRETPPTTNRGAPTSNEPLGSWLGRSRLIESIHCVRMPGSQPRVAQAPSLSVSRVRGNAKRTANQGFSTFAFGEQGDTHQILLQFPAALLGNGLSASIRLRGWESIRYVAIGYTHDAAFRHVKIVHPIRDAWTTIGFCHDELAFALQNDWASPEDTCIPDLKLYIKGKQAGEEAYLDLDEIAIWRARKADFPIADHGDGVTSASMLTARGRILANFEEVRPEILEATYDYLRGCFRDAGAQARRFMEHGDVPLYENVNLRWNLEVSKPIDLEKIGNHRYSWHALHPAVILLMEFRRTASPSYLGAARSFIEAWLSDSYEKTNRDKTFVWSNQGTAERLICLVLMWCASVEYELDYRFMGRLLMSIHRHADLLHSETFYASDQSTRYCHRAWSQDLALLTAALALASLPAADVWRETAMARLADQFDMASVRDGDFAVSVEDTVGNRHGDEGIVEFAEKLTSLVTGQRSIAANRRGEGVS